MRAHRHDGSSSVMAIVMRKIYPLGAVNKTQSTWLLTSQSWIGTGVNREPDTSCSFRTFIIKAHSAGNSYVHLSVRAAGRLLQGPSPKHTCSGIGILKRLMTWHDDPQLDGRLNFLNATRFLIVLLQRRLCMTKTSDGTCIAVTAERRDERRDHYALLKRRLA